MGVAIKWLSVRHKQIDDICRTLSARAVRELEDPDQYDEETARNRMTLATNLLYGFTSSEGWQILLLGSAIDDEGLLWPRLSENDEVICSFVEEHVMFSSARAYSAGKALWTIEHDPNKSDDHLEASGELPDCFFRIRDREISRAAATSSKPPVPHGVAGMLAFFTDSTQFSEEPRFFDIPLRVVRDLTGYEYSMWWEGVSVIHRIEL